MAEFNSSTGITLKTNADSHAEQRVEYGAIVSGNAVPYVKTIDANTGEELDSYPLISESYWRYTGSRLIAQGLVEIKDGLLYINNSVNPQIRKTTAMSNKAGVDLVTANKSLGSHTLWDVDNSLTYYSEVIKQPDDKIYLSHGLRRRKSDGTEVTHTLYTAIKADGTREVTVTDVVPWRKMLNSGKTLWSGAKYMSGSQDATLSEKVSDQLCGIVLAWSAYSNSTAQNYSWNYTFVPKSHVANHNGSGVSCPMFDPDRIGMKYVYVSDTKITGNDRNTDNQNISGTNNVKYSNNYWVLRYVYGV